MTTRSALPAAAGKTRPAPARPARAAVAGPASARGPAVVARTAADEAASTARRPIALATLRAQASHCRECPLGALATQTVFGEGAGHARLMIVGEQPGDREDLVGRPFVGPAGHLLDKALAALGWDREAVYLTNAVKHFKHELRGKRRMHKTPGQLEILACAHWLQGEIEAVGPAALVALGGTAARSLMGRPVKVLSERGRWLQRSDGRRVLVTLHPSALLRGDPAGREREFERWVHDLALASDVLRKH
ncbi:MAG TPA: UdgX family uracil-DNA binding protein [Burkholderiaceae bacterium]